MCVHVCVLVSPLSLTSVSSSSFRPSCQRVMSRCREKSQQALCSAVSFHWSNADNKLVPGSTSTCSTVNTTSLLLTADLAPIEEYWQVIGKVLTDGGCSSRQGGSGSLVHAVCWSLAFLWSLEVGVGVHTSRNHQLTICIHHLYARWDNQVLTDLSGWDNDRKCGDVTDGVEPTSNNISIFTWWFHPPHRCQHRTTDHHSRSFLL